VFESAIAGRSEAGQGFEKWGTRIALELVRADLFEAAKGVTVVVGKLSLSSKQRYYFALY